MVLLYNISKLKGRSFNLKIINLKKKEEANEKLYIENILEDVKENIEIFFYHNNFYVKSEGLNFIINKNKHLFEKINDIDIFNPIKVNEAKIPKIKNNNDIIKFLEERKNKNSNNEKGFISLINKYNKNIDNLKNLKNYKKIVSLDMEYIKPNIQNIREIGYYIIDNKNNTKKSRYIIINEFHTDKASTKTESVRLEKMREVENNIEPLFLNINEALKLFYDEIEGMDCLIGHNLNTELKILKNRFAETDKIDSQYVFSILKKEANFYSVEDMLKDLNINHKKLHNAYNDSFYTYKAIEKMNEKNTKLNHKKTNLFKR